MISRYRVLSVRIMLSLLLVLFAQACTSAGDEDADSSGSGTSVDGTDGGVAQGSEPDSTPGSTPGSTPNNNPDPEPDPSAGNGNSAPLANAGGDQNVLEGSQVTLDAGGSSDPDGDVLSFSWEQVSGPGLVLTNATSANAMFTAPDVAAETTLIFRVTVSDDNAGSATDVVQVTVRDEQSGAVVTISGVARYDHVPPSVLPQTGLDYDNIVQDPIRGAVVQAVDSSNVTLAVTSTDDLGQYSLAVPEGSNFRILVLSRTTGSVDASWDVRVVDNTNAQATYALASPLQTAVGDATLDLLASSGWDAGAAEYSGTRAAGPFAILDSIYEAIRQTTAVDATAQLPALLVNWSVANSSTCGGNPSNGCIGTSFYGAGQLFILGRADIDSDEYDGHVIVHEWGHYFEDRLSRADSIGGSHTGGESLDFRVAMGEGFGNALSGIITGDSVYRDSVGLRQSIDGVILDIDSDDDHGWFDEATVQALLFDLFDSDSDSPEDTLAYGWGPMYRTFVSESYRNTEAMTSIFSYLTQLRSDNPGDAAAITALAATRGVTGSDAFGSGETNDDSNSNVLPVYTVLEAGVGTILCSTDDFGLSNKLSNRRFATYTPTVSGDYSLTIDAITNQADPDFVVFLSGVDFDGDIGAGNVDQFVSLTAGQTYVFSTYHKGNVDNGASGTFCYTVTLNAP